MYAPGYISLTVYIRRFVWAMCILMSMCRIFLWISLCIWGPMYEAVCLSEAHFVILHTYVWLCVYFRHVWCMCTKGMCVYLRYFWPNKQHSHKYTHATFQHSIDNYCKIHYNTVQCCIVTHCALLSIAVCDFEHSRSSVECWYLSCSDTVLHSLLQSVPH